MHSAASGTHTRGFFGQARSCCSGCSAARDTSEANARGLLLWLQVRGWTLRQVTPLTQAVQRVPYPIPPAGADPATYRSEEEPPPLGFTYPVSRAGGRQGAESGRGWGESPTTTHIPPGLEAPLLARACHAICVLGAGSYALCTWVPWHLCMLQLQAEGMEHLGSILPPPAAEHMRSCMLPSSRVRAQLSRETVVLDSPPEVGWWNSEESAWSSEGIRWGRTAVHA